MQQPTESFERGPNGSSTVGEVLYALSDEQILGMEEGAGEPGGSGTGKEPSQSVPAITPPESQLGRDERGAAAPTATDASSQSPNRQDGADEIPRTEKPALETTGKTGAPPEWLAQLMNDPQRGGEAKQFWQQAQDAMARAGQLETIDRAYFSGDAAARARLAETLLREDPAAFREMLAAGMRALEKGGGKIGAGPSESRPGQDAGRIAPPNAAESPASGMTEQSLERYAAFERAANAELKRDVGGVIERLLDAALPARGASESARATRERVAAAVAQDIEATLRSDRQLGEQVALIISGRRPGEAGTPTPRFDDAVRAQVVQLIGARARALAPTAAKRVLGEWTQAAMSAHRERTARRAGAETRADLAPAEGAAPIPRSAKSAVPGMAEKGSGAGAARRLDYRAMTDEQILEL